MNFFKDNLIDCLDKLGFSLVEIAIAMLVLGLVLVPIFSVFEHSSSGTVQTRTELLAANYADELSCWLQTLPFNHTALTPNNAPVPMNPPSELADDMEPGFQRLLAIKEFAPQGHSFKYKVLTIIVSWKTGGPSREIRLCTLKYSYGN